MVFIKRGIVVPAGSRCCNNHLYNNHLTYGALHEITFAKTDKVTLDANSVVELIGDCCTTIQNMKTFDFDDPTSLDDETYYNMTGLQKGIDCLVNILFSFLIQINLIIY